jgi:5-methylcytosine-specific restriction enzyme subunit McrC
MIIPVRNLYFIFVYAWARFPGGPIVDAGVDQCPTLLDLFAHLLIREAQTLLRRGLAHDYEPLKDELAVPRGKIALYETIRLQQQLRNRVACRFDEFTSNRACNQIVKASALALIRSAQVTAAHHDGLRAVITRLARIDDVRLDAELFKRAQPVGGLRRYRFILSLCQLLFRAQLPDEKGTSTRFADVLESQAIMGKVFEAFLRNFYAHEQTSYCVGPEIMRWEAEPANAASAALLPVMQTDITLRSRERILVVEAKYYPEALAARFGATRLRSTHLYQLFTYLEHAGHPQNILPVDGLLIYPVAAHRVSAAYRLRGHGVRAETLDLTQPWPEIAHQLIGFLDGVRSANGE